MGSRMTQVCIVIKKQLRQTEFEIKLFFTVVTE